VRRDRRGPSEFDAQSLNVLLARDLQHGWMQRRLLSLGLRPKLQTLDEVILLREHCSSNLAAFDAVTACATAFRDRVFATVALCGNPSANCYIILYDRYFALNTQLISIFSRARDTGRSSWDQKHETPGQSQPSRMQDKACGLGPV